MKEERQQQDAGKSGGGERQAKDSGRSFKGARRGYMLGMSFTLMSAILWGSTYPIIKIALLYFTPYQISFFRASFGSASLLVYLVFRGKFKTAFPHGEREFLRVFVASLIGATLFWTFLNLSIEYLQPDISTFLVALYPLFAIVLATVLLRERMTLRRACGVALGLAGTYLIVVYSSDVKVTGSYPILGIVSALCAAFSWAGYMVLSRVLMEEKETKENLRESAISPDKLTFNTFLLAIPTTFVLSLVASLPVGGYLSAVSKNDYEPLVYVVYLGVLTSAFAFLIFNVGMRRIGVSASAINQLLFPVVAVILSFFLGEVLTLSEVSGMALIATGIIIAQVSQEEGERGQRG